MPPKLQIIGNEDKAVPYILWAKRQWELREGTWYKHTGDCLIQFIRNGDDGFIRLIPEGITRLVFTPRSGELQDTPYRYGDMLTKDMVDYTPAINGTGWLPQTDGYGFIPFLRDMVWPPTTGEQTAVAYTKEDDLFEFIGKESNYGNLCWVSDDAEYACSWSGTPTRHFRDTFKQYFETFTNNIFIAGEIIPGPVYTEDGGDYVLGASYPDGVLYVIGYHRLYPAVLKVSRLDSEWVELGQIDHGYDGLPWFADSTGLKFTHTDGTVVEIDGADVLETEAETYEGEGTEKNTGKPSWSGNFHGEYLFEDTGKAILDFVQSISAEASSDSDTSTGSFQLEHRAVFSTSIGISGPYDIAVGAVYSAQYSGTHCSFSWNADAGYEISEDTGSITITDISSCGMGSVSVAVVGGGNGGVSASMVVKQPNGVWIQELYIGAYETCNDYGMPYYWARTSGAMRYLYRVYLRVTYDNSVPCISQDIVNFDNGIASGKWYGPEWGVADGWCNRGGGGYSGCGACVYGSYGCYSADLMRIERWVCP